MIYNPENVKGFQDFLPPESLKRQTVREVIEKWFKLYGFLPVETPTIEFDELMRSDTFGQEDEAVSDRFRLQDRGGRNLGLRYEFTFQLARIFKQNPNMKLPFRRYQIGNVFRDEPTSTGRFREFTQCDVDIIGQEDINADAECLSLLNSILEELNVQAEIQVNNRKLINSILDSVKIDEKIQAMRELDKLDKIGEDTVKLNLKKYADSTQILTLFKLLEKDLDFFVQNMFDGAEELKKLEEKCKINGFKIKFNPLMIRGMAYYTGSIFEAKMPGKNSIAAGGRYDKVVGKYLGKEIPAVGISFGLERMTEVANIQTKQTGAIIISIDQDKEATKLAQKLRAAGVSCIVSSDKVGKSLEFADSYKIKYSIIIGAEEIKMKKYKIKNLESGKEEFVTDKQIVKKLI